MDVITIVFQITKLFASLKNPGLSSVVESVNTKTLSPTNPLVSGMEKLSLKIQRKSTTISSTFGELTYGEFKCFTLENSKTLIDAGSYSARLDKSPHLGYQTPHLQVPKRDLLAGGDAGLRIHVANFPSQLEGCVAVGLSLGLDSVEHSHAAFDSLIKLLPTSFAVTIYDAP